MDEDQKLVSYNEILWFCQQIDTTKYQLEGVKEKLEVLKEIINSDTLYYGAASENLKVYFAGMTEHMETLNYLLSLGTTFLRNTLASTKDMDEDTGNRIKAMH